MVSLRLRGEACTAVLHPWKLLASCFLCPLCDPADPKDPALSQLYLQLLSKCRCTIESPSCQQWVAMSPVAPSLVLVSLEARG